MFVQLLFVALFARAITAQVETTPAGESSGNDVFFALIEDEFQQSHPGIYNLIESFREVFGIPKEKMRNFSMKALETFSGLQDLWNAIRDLFKKDEKPHATVNTNYMYMTPNRNRRNSYSH